MERISRHSMFMGFAEVAARRSTCYRRSVGAVLVANNNVISVGYNGAPSGESHCIGKDCASHGVCIRAVHAERNVFERAGDFPTGTQLYVTESPCPECASIIVAHRVAQVFYLNEYRLVQGIKLLVDNNIQVFRMTPGGYLIDYKTNELVDET